VTVIVKVRLGCCEIIAMCGTVIDAGAFPGKVFGIGD
jgi:hypothetical protein